MDITNKEFQIAIIIIMAIIIGRVITLIVDTAFKRAVNNDFISKADCLACKVGIKEHRDELSKQVRIIKGLLLVVAIKIGVSDDQLQDLIVNREGKE